MSDDKFSELVEDYLSRNRESWKSSKKFMAKFVDLLRKRAGIDGLPVKLEEVISYYDLKEPKLEELGESVRGMMVKKDLPLIVNEADRETVRKFSLAHEIMELFWQHYEDYGGTESLHYPTLKDEAKERLCNVGATELLMPSQPFYHLTENKGLSLDSAKQIASICELSLTATLRRMVQMGIERSCFVIWHKAKNDKLQQEAKLMEVEDSQKAERPLTVHLFAASPDAGYINHEATLDKDTHIYESFETNDTVKGEDYLNLGNPKGRFYTESFPFNGGDKKDVRSLIHLGAKEKTEELNF